MIYYYSGTGNSEYAARELGRMTGHKHAPVSIPEQMRRSQLDVYCGKELGFVFPIYSWGVPPIVMQFVEKLPAELFKDRYIWVACTCGDEAGMAMDRFAKAIKRVCGREPDLCMSVIMPNNYVLLPGFNVDPPEVADRKLAEAPKRLRLIADTIAAHKPAVRDVHRGSLPALRSMIYPLFKRWGVNPRKWAASDACVSCGRCVRICPSHNIGLSPEDSRPRWGADCLSCCACFHVCPERAISYGYFTRHKGQYLFPGYPTRK